MLGDVVLTEQEALAINALQTIEPTIERVAFASSNGGSIERGSIFVKCRGQRERIPIGIMGDGVWRMLALSLTLASAKGGTLLIDEIDMGLHYSVMEDMWRLVCRSAEQLDVQVFATTHSRDCYESLASVLREQPDSDIAAIHRIEPDKKRTTTFNAQEIVMAAERGIEVR